MSTAWKQVRDFDRNVSEAAGLCHKFVRRGFDIGPGGPKGEPIGSAWAGWLFSKTKHTDRSFPLNVAVPIWFSHYGSYGSPKKYDNWGHVVAWCPATAFHNAGYVSSPGSGVGRKWFSNIPAIESYFKAKFVGWTEDVNGTRVIERVPLAANQRQVKPDSNLNIRSAPTTQKSKVLGAFTKGSIYAFDYHVIGELYGGIDKWLVVKDGQFVWAGGFTDSSVTGIPLLETGPTAPEPEPLPEPEPEPQPEPEPEPVITVETETVTEEIGFATLRVETDELPLGVENIERPGELGLATTIYRVTYTDGVETARELVEEILIDPVDELVYVGTAEPIDEDDADDNTPTSHHAGWVVALVFAVIAGIIGLFGRDKGAEQMSEEVESSQVVYPWNATARTAIEVVLGVIGTIFAAIIGLGTFAPELLEAIREILPPETYAWLAGIVAFLVTLSAAVARIMAIPVVNEWLKKVKLGATPKGK